MTLSMPRTLTRPRGPGMHAAAHRRTDTGGLRWRTVLYVGTGGDAVDAFCALPGCERFILGAHAASGFCSDAHLSASLGAGPVSVGPTAGATWLPVDGTAIIEADHPRRGSRWSRL